MADADGGSSSDEVALEENEEEGGADEECLVLEENGGGCGGGDGDSSSDDALVLEANDGDEAWELVLEASDHGGGSPRGSGSDNELILEDNDANSLSHGGPPAATTSAGTAPTTASGLELLRADEGDEAEQSALELFNASVPSAAERLASALGELPLEAAQASALAAQGARLCVLDAKDVHAELKAMGVGKLGLRQKVHLGYTSRAYLDTARLR